VYAARARAVLGVKVASLRRCVAVRSPSASLVPSARLRRFVHRRLRRRKPTLGPVRAVEADGGGMPCCGSAVTPKGAKRSGAAPERRLTATAQQGRSILPPPADRAQQDDFNSFLP